MEQEKQIGTPLRCKFIRTGTRKDHVSTGTIRYRTLLSIRSKNCKTIGRAAIYAKEKKHQNGALKLSGDKKGHTAKVDSPGDVVRESKDQNIPRM